MTNFPKFATFHLHKTLILLFTRQMHTNISELEHEIVFTLHTPLTLQTIIKTKNSLIIHITIMYLGTALGTGSSHGLTFLWSNKVAFD